MSITTGNNAFQQGLGIIEKNINRDFNVIPSPFKRLARFYSGVEWGTFNIITASSGVGKSQFTDFHYVLNPTDFYYQNYDKIRLKIFYYSLEMSPSIKALQFLAYKIYKDTGKRIGIKKMMSVNGKLSQEELDLVYSYREYFNWFFQVVELFGGPVTPYAIFKQIDNFYKANGKIIRKEAYDHKYDPKLGRDVAIKREQGVIDHYEPNDPDLMVILVIDHASLISTPKDLSLRESVGKLSNYMVQLRNLFGLTIAWIHQQSADQESKDNFRRPTLSGLGDNKAIQRDADNIFGLYDPYRHNDRNCNGWDIMKMNQRYRELTLMKSRYGPANMKTDLFYDGTTEFFTELPRAGIDDPKVINQWMDYSKTLPIIL